MKTIQLPEHGAIFSGYKGIQVKFNGYRKVWVDVFDDTWYSSTHQVLITMAYANGELMRIIK